MFKQRAFTSVFIVLTVLGLLLCNIASLQLLAVYSIIGICGLEWLNLMPIKCHYAQGIYLTVLLAVAITLGWFGGHLTVYLNVLTLLTWSLIIMAVITYPFSQMVWGRPWIVALLGWLVLPLFVYALVTLFSRFEDGVFIILYTIILVWAADVGAYLSGKLWGRHKLIPHVSPGKSWEGAAGGLMLTLCVAWSAIYFFHPASRVSWILMAIMIFWQSVFGDLFISMLKRRCKLKDTGTLLPGHGGFLDRLDSLIAVMPMALLLFSYCYAQP